MPFNDAAAFEALLAERGDEIACLILEPVMMNIGIVEPEPGYLQALKDLCDRHGVVLIFDEVKSGATVAEGGAGERYGVRPHLACFAKALFGGTPGAAFGGDAAVMDVIGHGAAQMGTFNGNPLVAAAGLACLTEVLTPDGLRAAGRAGRPPRRRMPGGHRRQRHPGPHRRPRRQGVRVVPQGPVAQLPRLPRHQARAVRRRRSRGRSTGACS